jgi:hypothetical protein
VAACDYRQPGIAVASAEHADGAAVAERTSLVKLIRGHSGCAWRIGNFVGILNSPCTRTHLGLDKDAPDHRPVSPPSAGPIIAIPEVGGLHHRYERKAA